MSVNSLLLSYWDPDRFDHSNSSWTLLSHIWNSEKSLQNVYDYINASFHYNESTGQTVTCSINSVSTCMWDSTRKNHNKHNRLVRSRDIIIAQKVANIFGPPCWPQTQHSISSQYIFKTYIWPASFLILLKFISRSRDSSNLARKSLNITLIFGIC